MKDRKPKQSTRKAVLRLNEAFAFIKANRQVITPLFWVCCPMSKRQKEMALEGIGLLND